MEIPYDYMWSTKIPFFDAYGVLPDVIGSFANLLATQNHAQTVANAAMLLGVFDATYAISNDSFENTLLAFAGEVGYQHSGSYPALFGVPALSKTGVIQEDISDKLQQKPNTRLLAMAKLLGGMAKLYAPPKV